MAQLKEWLCNSLNIVSEFHALASYISQQIQLLMFKLFYSIYLIHVYAIFIHAECKTNMN